MNLPQSALVLLPCAPDTLVSHTPLASLALVEARLSVSRFLSGLSFLAFARIARYVEGSASM